MALLSRAAHPLHEPGGMERAVFLQARHLQRAGVETVLFTRPATRPGAFPGRTVCVPYGSTPGLRHGRVLDRSLHYPRFSQRLAAAVAQEVRAGRIDLVDAQGLCAWGYGRLRAQQALPAPLLMNPQGMEEHKTGGLKRLALVRLRRLSREAARAADRVVATDEATRGEVPRLLGVPAQKVVVLPNGIDPEEIDALTPADPFAASEQACPALSGMQLVVLSVGRLEWYKGFADVATALFGLQRAGALPARWTWLIVGQGPDRGAIQGACATLNLPAHLLGRVEDAVLHALYARADLFVHATRFEGSSLVTLEAMAHALPVVATRAGGIPDKVVEGETGFLVAPADVAGLATALAGLARDPGRRKLFGAAGRARVLQEFAWPVLVRRTIAVYEELLRGAGREAGA